jgi:hypothetical protein
MAIEKLTRVKFVKWGTKAQESENTTPEPLKTIFFYVENEEDIETLFNTNLDNVHLEKDGEVKKQ